jgi:hypothetical protein
MLDCLPHGRPSASQRCPEEEPVTARSLLSEFTELAHFLTIFTPFIVFLLINR